MEILQKCPKRYRYYRETETQGRHAVALEDIAPGNVVAAGRPTVALLNPDNRLGG